MVDAGPVVKKKHRRGAAEGARTSTRSGFRVAIEDRQATPTATRPAFPAGGSGLHRTQFEKRKKKKPFSVSFFSLRSLSQNISSSLTVELDVCSIATHDLVGRLVGTDQKA